jgi:hypothetical protein
MLLVHKLIEEFGSKIIEKFEVFHSDLAKCVSFLAVVAVFGLIIFPILFHK